jgi:hypothetical protein
MIFLSEVACLLVRRMVGSSWPRSLMKSWRRVEPALEDLRGAEAPHRHVELDEAPCGSREVGDLGEERRRPPPERHELDAHRVYAGEVLVGGQT